ncbi:MAG: serine/threonine-protein kinase [candidate division Zixibacteria bacterium]
MDDRLIKGRYKLLGLTGEGGLARVFRAVDNFTDNEVAVKEIRDDDPAVIESVEREYRFAALNSHPSLVPTLSICRDSKSVITVMPFIEGIDLRTFPNRCSMNEYQIDRIIVSLLEAAAFIHFSGHIYNDFKPENILISGDIKEGSRKIPRLVLLDYNLISAIGENVSKRGTIEYVAPEILLGQQPDLYSDLYSLGVVIYELLSGAVPFSSKSTDKLIKLITEDGSIDYSKIPEKYRDGLRALLARDIAQRPSGAREAAGTFSLESIFDSLYRTRIDHYLSAGIPPFNRDLAVSFESYLKGMSCKIFSIRSLNHNRMAINYLAAEYELRGYNVWRIGPEMRPDNALDYLKKIKSWRNDYSDGKSILLIDHLEALDNTVLSYLRSTAGPANGLPVAAGVNRWIEPAISTDVFDPLKNQTKIGATATSLKAYLKKEDLDFNFDDLSRCSGGDPTMVYLHLKYALLENGPVTLSKSFDDRIRIEALPVTARDKIIARIFDSLRDDQIDILKKLSVWGDSIPMLILAALGRGKQMLIDELLKSGRLIPEKDAVSFSSGNARDFVCESVPDEEKRRYHGFWAEAVEEWLSETDDYIESAACHWGGSEDICRGYKANYIAALEFFKKGELSKAEFYADKTQVLAEAGGGSVADSLAVYADIYKEKGDYRSARVKYLELLRNIRLKGDKEFEAKTDKNLGDLYRSIRKTRKAVYYINAALKLYMELGDDQGVADCNNNIGLTYWIDEQYDKALESFSKAFEANRKVNNQRELAKIQSNQGIIKDIVGKTKEVADHFIKALRYASESDDPRLEALISNNLGYFYIRQGEYKEANKYLRATLAISEKIGYTEGVINSLSNLGLSYLRSGDLFAAVDFDQKALETAESLGSRHLAASAELYLAEACILMGNYSLADSVLSSIEAGKAIEEDKSLKSQTELLRSGLMISLGDTCSAHDFAARVLLEAESVGDTRLKIEAELSLARAFLDDRKHGALVGLSEAAETASTLGHDDLLSAAGILLASFYTLKEDFFNAEGWLDRVLLSQDLTRESLIKAKILVSDLYRLNGRYDDALEILYEIESLAAVSGFVPLAFRAAVILSEIFLACSKLSRLKETIDRALSYRAKLLSALPESASASTLEQTSYMKRFSSVITKTDNKVFLSV